MKKTVFILMFIGFLIENGLAQEKQENIGFSLKNTSQKQSVTVDIFPAIEGAIEGNTGIGLFYERRIWNWLS